MATELSSLYKYLVTELPGCPQALMLDVIRDVIIEFNEETLNWQATLDAINIREDKTEYELDSPESCAEIFLVRSVKQQDTYLQEVEDYKLKVGTKTTIELEDEPQADIASGLVVKVALRLKSTATKVCDRQYADYRRSWVHGVLMYLKAYPNKTWTDKEGSTFHRQFWIRGMSAANIERTRGSLNVGLRAQPAFGFVPRSRAVNTDSF